MRNWQRKILGIFGVSLALLCLTPFQSTAQTMALDTVDITRKQFSEKQGLGNWDKLFTKTEGDGEKREAYVCGEAGICAENQRCMVCEENQGNGPDGMPKLANYKNYCIDKNDDPENYSSKGFSGFIQMAGNRHIKCSWAQEGDNFDLVSNGLWYKEVGKCLIGSDEKEYCLASEGGQPTIEYGSTNKTQQGCEVLPVKINQARKCFFCPLVAIVYNASAKMPMISFNTLGSAFATLMALGMALWVAFQTLTHVSSLTKQDGPKFLGGLIKQSYKFLLAFLILQNSSWIFANGVVPIMEAGIRFGDVMLPIQSSNDKISLERDALDEDAGIKDGSDLDSGFYTQSIERAKGITQNEYLPKNLYLSIDMYISNIQYNLAIMQSVGTSLICAGWNGMRVFKSSEKTRWGDGVKMAAQGIVLAAFAFLLIIAFTFYLLDAVVQLGIVGALAPFLIASWPFKLTSQYAGTGMKMVLNSAFVFMFIGLVVNVNLTLVESALMNTQTATIQKEKDVEKEALSSGLKDIIIAFNANDEDELKKLTDISGMGFLILLFCCIFGFKFTNQVSSLAGQFASGGMKPIAPSIATMGASAVTSAAKKVAKPTMDAVGRHAGNAVKAVAGAPFSLARAGGRGLVNAIKGKKKDDNKDKKKNDEESPKTPTTAVIKAKSDIKKPAPDNPDPKTAVVTGAEGGAGASVENNAQPNGGGTPVENNAQPAEENGGGAPAGDNAQPTAENGGGAGNPVQDAGAPTEDASGGGAGGAGTPVENNAQPAEENGGGAPAGDNAQPTAENNGGSGAGGDSAKLNNENREQPQNKGQPSNVKKKNKSSSKGGRKGSYPKQPKLSAKTNKQNINKKNRTKKHK